VKKSTVLTLAAILLAAPSFAQDEKVWVDVNVGIAHSVQDDVTTTFTGHVFQEPFALAAAYGQPQRGADFDFGGGYLFTPVMGVSISVSGTAHEDPAGLAVTLPHPFFFNAAATGSGATEDALVRAEGSVHLQVVASPLRRENVVLRLFGGPSYFRVAQDVVEDIGVSQTATILSRANTVTVTGWSGREEEGTGWGFHVGADVGFFFTRVVGVGGMLRFSRGNVEIFDPLSETDIELTAGGIQAGGGLRLKF
jgi:hypothetical protein